MAAAVEPFPTTPAFAANESALQTATTLDLLTALHEPIPAEVQESTGRDGAATYCWTDQAGIPRWLGRTTMPTISEPAIVDSFRPDAENVLLFTIGHGTGCRLILERTAPFQAVMVLAPEPWQLALALRLHDFSRWIRNGRLLLFVGDDAAGNDAWDRLRGFLLDHSGYLEPQRVLSWPWLTADEIERITTRLGAIQKDVGAHRARKRAELPWPPSGTPNRTSGRASTQSLRWAVVTNVAHPDVLDLAENLSDAALFLGGRVDRLTPESPRRIHPLAAEEALVALAPTLTVLIDAAPTTLSHRLPDGPRFVICTHREAPDAAWLNSIGDDARLGVMSPRVAEQIGKSGLAPARVHIILPAADVRAAALGDATGGHIAVIADGGDASAASAGLHLTTHCRLWDETAKIIDRRVDEFTNAAGERVLDEAQRKLRIQFEDEEVRGGILSRIVGLLGPRTVSTRFVEAMAAAEVDFDLFGDGWTGHAAAPRLRGPAPRRETSLEIVERSAALVFPSTDGGVPQLLMDALCAGRVVFVRRHPRDDTDEGLAAVLDLQKHVYRFGTRQELTDMIRRFRATPDEFLRAARAAAEHVRGSHTWTHRLTTIRASIPN